MTSKDFCYWLQGYFELSSPSGGLTKEQADSIAKHLALVFKHEIDPSAGSPEHQAALDAIHNAGKPSEIGGVGPGGTVYRC